MKLKSGRPEDAGMSMDRINRIKQNAESWITEGHHPALAILVARKGIIVIHEAYGKLSPDKDSPTLQTDSIFPLASLVKPITATAAMILVEEGQLSLNRPVAMYIPEFATAGKEMVMVHQLLTHTSGLIDGDIKNHIEKVKGSIEIPPPPNTQHQEIHEMLNLSYSVQLSEVPGSIMIYADTNYILLGEIIRRISGESLSDFAQKRIFSPLGMKNTFYGRSEGNEDRIVRRPDGTPGAGSEDEFRRGDGATGGFSTVKDMAILGQMFLNGGTYGGNQILSKASITAMTSNFIPGTKARFGDEVFPEAGWSLGWCIKADKIIPAYGEPLQSPQTYEHGGSGGVFMWVDPVAEIVGVYFSVVLAVINDFLPVWDADLFVNSVTGAIVD